MVAFICNFMVRSRLFYVTLQTNERPPRWRLTDAKWTHSLLHKVAMEQKIWL
jgi:hypothetical protein